MINAVMFDIDDTLIRVRDGSPIVEMIDLLRRSQMAGYRIVIITARPWYSSNVAWTQRQLAQYGIHYDDIYFCMPQDKTRVKQELINKHGYHFILSVGDMPTDLTDSDDYINTSIFCHN